MNVFSCTGRLGRDSKTNQTQGGEMPDKPELEQA